jgi:hypothetical protein
MITPDNIKHVLTELLTAKEINTEIDKEHDYISLQISIFNSGAVAHLQSVDYNEEQEQEHHDNGNLFCDKDQFLMLASENGLNF